ncbi:unnamed protein product [Adineta steineri]|uniref:JmjC domain-containing protein n=1 Tax=Adineta steineri TaxID=433720 RepID=A0A815FDB5_9BILA|nr:unnamed protein product [Adineta steineri]
MFYYRQLILINFFLVYLSASSQHSGHLKPFGSSGPFEQIDKLTNDFPDPILFFENYAFKSHPVLFRQVLANDLYLSLWNKDKKLKKLFLNNKEIVHVETRKKESRKQNILTMTMTDFLKRYQSEELYLVEEVPKLVRPYFTLPKCLQCEPAIETFQVAMLWFSSGNTSSVVHTDDYDNINCVLQGEKQFILIDPHTYKHVASQIIDNPSGSFSSIDVDRVNYDKYSSLDNDIHYYQVNLTRGDCLFIPALWIHQVRSSDRNIAVNYWLNHARVKNAVINQNTCELLKQSNLMTLDTITWPKELSNLEGLQDFMFDLIDEGATSFKDWTREFSKDLNFDLHSNTGIITLFAEFFNMIDTNENGFIAVNELELLLDDNNNMTAAFEILQDIVNLIEIKSGKDVQSNNQNIDEILSGDETEKDDDINLKHEDL